MYVERLASEFHKRGVKVKLLTYADKLSQDIKYDFPLVRVSRRFPKVIRHILYFFQTLRLAKDGNVIYAQNLFSVGIPGLVASKILRKKLVVKIVGDYAWEQARMRWGIKDNIDGFQKRTYSFPVELLRKTQSFLARKAFRVITPSFYLKKIIKGWGVPEQNIEVIYNALDVLEEPDISKAEAKKRIGIGGDVILSIGRLAIWKGFLALIDTFPDLLKENPNFRLIIVGDGEEKKNLELKIENLGLKKSVKLVGRVNHQDIPLYFKAADIFILNSGYEGLPHVILEAMQLGVPVVASSKGGNLEVIKDGFNGFLVEYNNKEQIRNTMLNLWQDKELQEKFIKNSKEKLKEFSFERMVTKTLKTLKS